MRAGRSRNGNWRRRPFRPAPSMRASSRGDPMIGQAFDRRIHRWVRAVAIGAARTGLALIVSLGARGTSAAQNRDARAPDAVPASWSRFAALVQSRFAASLAGDDALAQRFH